MKLDIFIAFILSLIYGLSFGFTIILLGFLQGQRKRSQQLFISLIDGTIKISLLVFLTKSSFPNHIYAIFYLTLGSLLSCIAIYLLLPVVSPELFPNQNKFNIIPPFEITHFPEETLDSREREQVLSASKFGVIAGLQSFLEVYVVGVFYGLEASAALVILTKFAFTPSVFIANSFLAYVAPILYAKSEIVYSGRRSILILKYFKNFSFIFILLISGSMGLISFYVAPYLFKFFFPPSYQEFSGFFAYFVFSGFLTTLAMINFPIIETFKGSSVIYFNRSFLAIFTLALNFLLTFFFGLNGAAISFVLSALVACVLFNIRFIFKDIFYIT